MPCGRERWGLFNAVPSDSSDIDDDSSVQNKDIAPAERSGISYWFETEGRETVHN